MNLSKCLKITFVFSTICVGRDAVSEPLHCQEFGTSYKDMRLADACYKINGKYETGLFVFDPDNPIDVPRVYKNISKLEIDGFALKNTEIGTLAAFVRLQAEYDPDITSNQLLAFETPNRAIGLDTFKVSLHEGHREIAVGRIENAGAYFISDGFTSRGIESLDSRAGLGLIAVDKFGDFQLGLSISDPGTTTDFSPIGPNVAVGARYDMRNFDINFGAALVNVDQFRAFSQLGDAVRKREGFVFSKNATYGFGFGVEAAADLNFISLFAGAAYSKGASGDLIFSFSDGFDAFTTYGGLWLRLDETLSLAGDVAYVAATQSGLRNHNGFDLAFNVLWEPIGRWSMLSELGYRTVDRFGSGVGNFYFSPTDGDFSWLSQFAREL